MKREESIKWLKLLKTSPLIYGEYTEAIDMAIEALKILGNDGIVNCCGCIHWKTDGGAMMMCELWDTPMGDFDYCSYGKREKPKIPMFKESEEAYKAWIGEEMGGDEIDEMNRKIIKDILKMMPTAYLLEALGISTFEELTEQADRPHGEWIPHATSVGDKRYIEYSRCSECGEMALVRMNFCPNCGADMRGDNGK